MNVTLHSGAEYHTGKIEFGILNGQLVVAFYIDGLNKIEGARVIPAADIKSIIATY